jgi:hypothetical protein
LGQGSAGRSSFIGQAPGGTVAFFECRDFLGNAIFADAEIPGIETADITSLIIGNCDIQLDEVDINKNVTTILRSRVLAGVRAKAQEY